MPPLQLPLKYIAIFVVSMMFPALDSITKEKVPIAWLSCLVSTPWLGLMPSVVQSAAPWHRAQAQRCMHVAALRSAHCGSSSQHMSLPGHMACSGNASLRL